LPELARILFGASFTLAACYACGSLITRRFPLPRVIRLAVGGAVLSYVVFLLFAVGAGRLWVFVGLGAAVILSAARLSRLHFPRAIKLDRPVAAVFAVYGFLYLVHALAPEVRADGYTYHLGLPAEWFRQGALSPRIGFYEMLPHGMEMLFAFAFALGGHSAAKLLHFGFLVATIPLMVAVGRRLGLPESACWVGAGLYFCAPVVGTAGTAAYNDAALVFFFLATIYLLAAWWQEGRTHQLVLLGLVAGFCYAIKPTGLLAAPAAVAVVALRRKLRSSLLVAAGAAAMIAPWMVRNAVRTGNPVAPLANRLFPNPHFHILTEIELTGALRSYEGVTWRNLPWELTLRGRRLQGFVGPIFLLAPLALLGLRRRGVRLLLGSAALLAVPWMFNIGARFFMPSLALLALAMATVLPRRLALAGLLIQAILCLPPVAAAYVEPGAWRLDGMPWRAALRLEPEHEYLRRTLWEYRAAEMVTRHLPPRTRLLDLVGLPLAYLSAETVAPWQSAATDRLGYALQIARLVERGVYSDIEVRWPETELAAIRFVQTARAEFQWGIAEVRLRNGSNSVPLPPGSKLLARPNVWDAPLAFDHNLISRWGTWEPVRPGMYLGVDFGRTLRLDGVRLTVLTHEQAGAIRFEGRTARGDWRTLASSARLEYRSAMNLRRSAMRLLKQEGFGYLVVDTRPSGYGPVGQSMYERPADWGVELLEETDGVYLFAVR